MVGLQAVSDAAFRPPATAREPAESELLDALAGGDREAAEELVRRTYEMVYASLVRLSGSPDLAADLTQDTYRKAWSSLASFRRGAKFSTWLYRIAYNTFLNHKRRPHIVQPLDDEQAQAVPDEAPGADEAVADSEISASLREHVLQLPEPQRWVVTARFWGEVSVREIAAAEGVTTVAIRKRIKKAMKTIRLHLEEGGVS